MLLRVCVCLLFPSFIIIFVVVVLFSLNEREQKNECDLNGVLTLSR
jgi:hypothetical protein